MVSPNPQRSVWCPRNPGDVTARVNHVLRRTHRENVVGCVVIVERDADLFEIVGALNSPRCFPRDLHRGQEQRDQNRDDRDDDEQFDQCETPATSRWLDHGYLT